MVHFIAWIFYRLWWLSHLFCTKLVTSLQSQRLYEHCKSLNNNKSEFNEFLVLSRKYLVSRQRKCNWVLNVQEMYFPSQRCLACNNPRPRYHFEGGRGSTDAGRMGGERASLPISLTWRKEQCSKPELGRVPTRQFKHHTDLFWILPTFSCFEIIHFVDLGHFLLSTEVRNALHTEKLLHLSWMFNAVVVLMRAGWSAG